MPKPASDIDTISNADELWRIVHMIQETISRNGSVLRLPSDEPLAELRRLADELDPDYGREFR